MTRIIMYYIDYIKPEVLEDITKSFRPIALIAENESRLKPITVKSDVIVAAYGTTQG
jgi:hypothetical protein